MTIQTPSVETAEKRSIAFECDLPEPPEKVWRALTTPEIVSEWLLPTDLRPETGKKFGFSDPDAANDPIECEVLAVEPQRSIRFSWRDAKAREEGLDSMVTFEIAEIAEGGTHLTIVHEVRHAAAIAGDEVTMTANDNFAPSMRLAA
jgi:uncharacterized protein YndB with AHSA1/START domain